jgi:hypothetical protein
MMLISQLLRSENCPVYLGRDHETRNRTTTLDSSTVQCGKRKHPDQEIQRITESAPDVPIGDADAPKVVRLWPSTLV